MSWLNHVSRYGRLALVAVFAIGILAACGSDEPSVVTAQHERAVLEPVTVVREEAARVEERAVPGLRDERVPVGGVAVGEALSPHRASGR